MNRKVPKNLSAILKGIKDTFAKVSIGQVCVPCETRWLSLDLYLGRNSAIRVTKDGLFALKGFEASGKLKGLTAFRRIVGSNLRDLTGLRLGVFLEVANEALDQGAAGEWNVSRLVASVDVGVVKTAISTAVGAGVGMATAAVVGVSAPVWIPVAATAFAGAAVGIWLDQIDEKFDITGRVAKGLEIAGDAVKAGITTAANATENAAKAVANTTKKVAAEIADEAKKATKGVANAARAATNAVGDAFSGLGHAFGC